MLPSPSSAKLRDTRIIRNQRAGKLDRRCDEETIRWVAVLETVKLITARSCAIAQRDGHNSRTVQEPLDPSGYRYIEINSTGIDEQRYLPRADCAQVNAATASPAIIDQGTS